LSPEEEDYVRWKLEVAERYGSLGDHEKAMPIFSEIASIYEKALGTHNIQTLNSLRDLANCLERLSEYGMAHDLYQRLLRIESTVFGADSERARSTRALVFKCSEAKDRANAISEFDSYFHQVLSDSARNASVYRSVRNERLLRVASKLEERRRFAWAGILFREWADAVIQNNEMDDEEAIQARTRYASFLCKVDEYAQAVSLLTSVVLIRNRQGQCIATAAPLKQALVDLAHCLEKKGDFKSAATTFELSEKLQIPA